MRGSGKIFRNNEQMQYYLRPSTPSFIYNIFAALIAKLNLLPVMKFKIGTKEKMQVITVEEPQLSANMAGELLDLCYSYLNEPIRNVVLDLQNVESMQQEAALKLPELQNTFMEGNASLVICNLQAPVKNTLDELDVLDVLNITPTESEAWDIVQMEEIERELLG